jgi:xanthine/uracil permease
VPPAGETLLYAWQHTLVDLSPFVLPIFVANAVGYSTEQAAYMISACLSGWARARRRPECVPD